MFLRSNLFHSGLEDRPVPFHGLYMGAFEGRVLTDVAAHYWNNCIILQAPTRPVEMALAVARESGRPVNGLLGPGPRTRRGGRIVAGRQGGRCGGSHPVH